MVTIVVHKYKITIAILLKHRQCLPMAEIVWHVSVWVFFPLQNEHVYLIATCIPGQQRDFCALCILLSLPWCAFCIFNKISGHIKVIIIT